MNRHLVISILIFAFVIVATFVIILVGKGYRFGINTGKIEIAGTGLLVLKSTPDTAQVFINGHLTTATNNTINLVPNSYDVKIFKDGYFPWEKKIIIEAEVVSQAQALLLPTAPKLESVSTNGAGNPIIDPSLSRIAFTVSSQSAKDNGVYILDTSSRPILTLQNAATQIVDDSINAFSKATLTWSPDGKEILASVPNSSGSQTFYLLTMDQFNSSPSNVTETLPSVMAKWVKKQQDIDASRLNSATKDLRKIIKNNFQVLSWSPDETKILYSASNSAIIPPVINPRLVGVNSTPEQRNITKGHIYVYDIKEDRNYELPSEDFINYSWLSDSGHFVFIKDGKINIMEYDSQNSTVFYAGPLSQNYVFPWSDLTRIVILTNLGNSSITPNLYTISLK